MAVYFIGGSPCSGKSTVAEALSEKYGLRYFKVDDYLDKYMKSGALNNKRICAKIERMTPEQIWMRDPQNQCEEELLIYEEIFEYVLADLKALDCSNGIITEGAAYLPVLAKRCGIPANRYIAITPEREFQISHFRQREWISYVLAECMDKEQAFENWMERDVLFAKEVQRQCRELDYVSLVNDGKMPVEKLIDFVAAHMELA